MFATPYSGQGSTRPMHGNLYQQVGIETRLSGATPHQLVAMLFDGFVDCVNQARGAIRANRADLKGMAIGRAVRIVEEGLRAGLDMSAGGTLARDLNDLYGYLTMRLTLANLHSDESALEECQRLINPLREAWMSIADKAQR
jgi:flagellar protein FliS